MAVLATLVVLCLLGVGAYVLVSYLSAHGIGIGAATTATPTPVPDPLAARRNDLLKEADTLAQVNKYDEADVKLTEALGTNPSDPEREAIQNKIGEYRSEQGSQYLKQRKYTEAAQVFKQAVDADPENAEWRFWWGQALLFKGSGEPRAIAKADFDQAKAVLEKAIEKDPNLRRAYQALAQTHVKLNDPVAAKNRYWEIVQRWPDSPEAIAAIRDLKGMGMQTPPPASSGAPPKPATP